MWFGPRRWTSALDLMRGSIKANGTREMCVSLHLPIVICPSLPLLSLLSSQRFAHTFEDRFLPHCGARVICELPKARAINKPGGTRAPCVWAGERAAVVKSLICTSWNSHKSPVPLPPPLSTSHTIPRSTELPIWGASGVYCDSIWLSTQGVRRHSFSYVPSKQKSWERAR